MTQEQRESRYLLDYEGHRTAISEGRMVIATYENVDKTEGRGPMRLIGLFTDWDAAMFSRKGKGIMGVTDHELLDTNVAFLPVFRNVTEYVDSLALSDPVRREALRSDPDYQEYLRLLRKFEPNRIVDP